MPSLHSRPPLTMLTQRVIQAFLCLGTLLFLGLSYFAIDYPRQTRSISYGVTWSAPYAASLGISSQEGLKAVLDDLGIRRFRIPVYWSLIETRPGTYDWQSLDEQLDLIQQHQGKTILAIGQKVPRWPECWLPDWIKPLPLEERGQASVAFLQAVVRHTVDRPSVVAYQVENEPLFPFGECPNIPVAQTKQEIQAVRSLDRALGYVHPIFTTDSGEFTAWIGFDRLIDGLGVSIYQSTRNAYTGVRKYHFIPPWFYQHKAGLIHFLQPYVYVSEFQMEPWVNGSMTETPFQTQFEVFDLKQMQQNFWYAQHTGFQEIYLWGAEWWYWMKVKNNHPEFWDTVRAELL